MATDLRFLCHARPGIPWTGYLPRYRAVALCAFLRERIQIAACPLVRSTRGRTTGRAERFAFHVRPRGKSPVSSRFLCSRARGTVLLEVAEACGFPCAGRASRCWAPAAPNLRVRRGRGHRGWATESHEIDAGERNGWTRARSRKPWARRRGCREATTCPWRGQNLKLRGADASRRKQRVREGLRQARLDESIVCHLGAPRESGSLARQVSGTQEGSVTGWPIHNCL